MLLYAKKKRDILGAVFFSGGGVRGGSSSFSLHVIRLFFKNF